MDIRIRRMDKSNIILEEKYITRKGKNKGRVYYKLIGYYTTPIGLSKALANLAMDIPDGDSIISQSKEFIELTGKKIDTIASQLSELIENQEVLIGL